MFELDNIVPIHNNFFYTHIIFKLTWGTSGVLMDIDLEKTCETTKLLWIDSLPGHD